MSLLRMGDWIDAFRPADQAPPQRWRVLPWSLSGSLGAAWAGGGPVVAGRGDRGGLGAGAGLGDRRGGDSATRPAFFADHGALMIWSMAFYLLVRAAAYAASSAAIQITLGPNLLPLVLSRLHRWTLGQALTFFDNDFAGRIAQKQMQAARAVTDVATETINTVFFALASVIASVASVRGRLVDRAALAVWLAAIWC
jgi:ATP-binding cassette subfamily B protein